MAEKNENLFKRILEPTNGREAVNVAKEEFKKFMEGEESLNINITFKNSKGDKTIILNDKFRPLTDKEIEWIFETFVYDGK